MPWHLITFINRCGYDVLCYDGVAMTRCKSTATSVHTRVGAFDVTVIRGCCRFRMYSTGPQTILQHITYTFDTHSICVQQIQPALLSDQHRVMWIPRYSRVQVCGAVKLALNCPFLWTFSSSFSNLHSYIRTDFLSEIFDAAPYALWLNPRQNNFEMKR